MGATHSYSHLIILTGAGASKACGLPDMRQFAKDFYASMPGRDKDYFDRELVCRLIYGQSSIKGNPEPKRDLEALLDGLTRLAEGTSGTCATTSTLLSIASEMGDNLKSMLHEITQKSEELGKKLEEHISYSERKELGVYPEIEPGMYPEIEPESYPYPKPEPKSYPYPYTLPRLDFKPESDPEAELHSQLFPAINPDDIEIPRSSISYEADTLKEISTATHSTAAERSKILKELPQRAAYLSDRVKRKILDAYSMPSPSFVQRAWGKVFKVLKMFESQALDLFTLNYDPVIEMLCQNTGTPRTCGFASNGQELVWRDDFALPQAKLSPLIRLYKIHGSVSWKGFGDRIVESHLFGTGKLRDLSGQAAKDMLIYPVTGKIFYGEPYFTLINHFRQALLNAQLCLIIGFSYRDEMIVDLLRFACRENSEIKFIHCGMAPSKLKSMSHLSEIVSRMEFTQKKFGHPKFADELNAMLGSNLVKNSQIAEDTKEE